MLAPSRTQCRRFEQPAETASQVVSGPSHESAFLCSPRRIVSKLVVLRVVLLVLMLTQPRPLIRPYFLPFACCVCDAGANAVSGDGVETRPGVVPKDPRKHEGMNQTVSCSPYYLDNGSGR